MEFEQRFLALGDSFTEGMGDVDVNRPNQVRGWADRVAENLCADGWGYANLAIRGKKIPQVLTEQIDAAVALKPTLVTLYAGGNDIMRPKVDITELVRGYGAAVKRLQDAGAEVIIFTGFDGSSSPVFGKLVGRTALYNERIREVADVTGARIADYWRWRDFDHMGYWATDRLHMNERGHELMSRKVLGVLGRAVTGEDPAPRELPSLTRWESTKENGRWAVEYVGPWVQRRLKGTSSGDKLSPRFPEWVSLATDGTVTR